jgi:hypothetical protein
MKVFRPELRTYALSVCTAMMAACTSPGYNDNPSQQITTARVGCPAATEFFAVYFSVRVQPLEENRDTRVTRDLFRSYCKEIPAPGKVFFTADLVGPELRKTPIGIRIVDEGAAGDHESEAENAGGLHTISEVLPKTYSKGVIESDFEVGRNGHYAIYLIRGGAEAVAEADTLRIPLNVGVESGTKRFISRSITLLGIASGLALIGFVAFRYVRRRMVL